LTADASLLVVSLIKTLRFLEASASSANDFDWLMSSVKAAATGGVIP
jgi:hypothetical protein